MAWAQHYLRFSSRQFTVSCTKLRLVGRASEVRRIIRRVVGLPVASGRVPARLPMWLERSQVLFDAISVPPLPAPLLLVHTAGKPISYRAPGGPGARQSIPGLVTFVPQHVRTEAALRGVGEGTLLYFETEREIPSWLRRARYTEPVTFPNEVIVSVTRRLMHELESGRADNAYLTTLGNALLAELRRELTRPESAVGPTAASRSELRIAHTAMQFVQAHLGNRLTVADLASACGLGLTSFSAAFRDATGTTPHRYLRRARIERACELLRTTGLSVREVAEAVGFRGQGHFCTAFTEERGLTPSAYRRAARPTVAVGTGRYRA